MNSATPSQPTSANCPRCGASAPRFADVAVCFVMHPERHAAGQFNCSQHGQFVALEAPPANLPCTDGADVEQNTCIVTCPFCTHDRAKLRQVLPVIAGASRFLRAGNWIAGAPFLGLAMACPKCHATWVSADPNGEVNDLKS